MDIKTTLTTTVLDFKQLVGLICQLDGILASQANKAVNASLTLRNWLIGLHVEEYEHSGVDRAEYGEKLMDKLSESLTKQGLSRCDRREIYRYRQFYITYPQIVEAVSPQLEPLTIALLQKTNGALTENTAQQMVETSPQLKIDGKILVSRLSFSHIVELLNVEDDTKRTFYEVECIQGNWSVRELKRQIHSLYFERCGLSIF